MNNVAEVFAAGLTTTVIGMGIVFVTLAFLAFILSLFKYLDKKKEEPTVTEPQPVIEEHIEEAPEEEGTDELELVAAITAAIAASLGTSSDKLRVVSIRRAEKTAWNHAARREQQRQVF